MIRVVQSEKKIKGVVSLFNYINRKYVGTIPKIGSVKFSSFSTKNKIPKISFPLLSSVPGAKKSVSKKAPRVHMY